MPVATHGAFKQITRPSATRLQELYFRPRSSCMHVHCKHDYRTIISNWTFSIDSISYGNTHNDIIQNTIYSILTDYAPISSYNGTLVVRQHPPLNNTVSMVSNWKTWYPNIYYGGHNTRKPSWNVMIWGKIGRHFDTTLCRIYMLTLQTNYLEMIFRYYFYTRPVISIQFLSFTSKSWLFYHLPDDASIASHAFSPPSFRQATTHKYSRCHTKLESFPPHWRSQ